MSLEFKNLIKHEFNKNKLLFNSELIEALEVFAQFLISENKKYNLTTILTPEDIVNKNVYPTNKEDLKVEDEEQGSALGTIGLKPKIVH